MKLLLYTNIWIKINKEVVAIKIVLELSFYLLEKYFRFISIWRIH